MSQASVKGFEIETGTGDLRRSYTHEQRVARIGPTLKVLRMSDLEVKPAWPVPDIWTQLFQRFEAIGLTSLFIAMDGEVQKPHERKIYQHHADDNRPMLGNSGRELVAAGEPYCPRNDPRHRNAKRNPPCDPGRAGECNDNRCGN